MKRATSIESAVASPISKVDCIKAVFVVGTLSMKVERYIAYSPDTVVILEIEMFPEWEDATVLQGFECQKLVLVSVEINIRIAFSTPWGSLELSLADVIRSELKLGDGTFQKYVIREHMGQIIYQIVVLRVEFCIYAVAGKTGMVYNAIIRILNTVQQVFERSVVSSAKPIIE